MTAPTPAELLMFGPLLVSGLLLPGWLLARLVPSPAILLSAFLGSAVILFQVVLALDALHLPLTLGTLTCVLAAIDLLLWLIGRRRPPAATRPPGHGTRPREMEWLWVGITALGLIGVAVHAAIEPLSGFDTSFRWDFLAREIVQRGNLSFYPPVTVADFSLYAWCDGIPPLVPFLNLWSYLCLGHLLAGATTPRVVAECALLFHAVWRLAHLYGKGSRPAWAATATLATSALLLWGVAIGQETGLTALSLVAMLLFLEEYVARGSGAALFWAGVAAGTGALSREYGLAWPLVGWGILALRGRMRPAGTFVLIAALIAAPWYVRNWVMTGNPLYPHALGGVFSVNPMHQELMEIIAQEFALGMNWVSAAGFFAGLAATAGLVIVLGAAGAIRSWKTAWPLVLASAVVAALWLASVPQTAGGWTYSSRVLTPALALAAVGAGLIVGRAGRMAALLLALVLPLAAIDASLRSLYLPYLPVAGPGDLTGGRWRDFYAITAQYTARPLWLTLAHEARDRSILVDHPLIHATLAKLGAHPMPLVSPVVAVALEQEGSFARAIALFRAGGVRFIVLSHGNVVPDNFIRRHRFFQELQKRGGVFHSVTEDVYDLDFLP